METTILNENKTEIPLTVIKALNLKNRDLIDWKINKKQNIVELSFRKK